MICGFYKGKWKENMQFWEESLFFYIDISEGKENC